MTSLLLEEELVPLSRLPASARRLLEGNVVRFVDDSGKTFGLFLSPEAMEEILEDLEYASPAFQEELEKSSASGTVSAASIKRRLKL